LDAHERQDQPALPGRVSQNNGGEKERESWGNQLMLARSNDHARTLLRGSS